MAVHGIGSAGYLLIIPAAVLAAACAALCAFAAWLWRSRARALRQGSDKEAGKSLKSLIYQVAYTMDEPGGAGGGAQSAQPRNIAERSEMAFVVTDIEGSTQLSVAGRDVYDQLLAMHDQIMRESIAKYRG